MANNNATVVLTEKDVSALRMVRAVRPRICLCCDWAHAASEHCLTTGPVIGSESLLGDDFSLALGLAVECGK